MKFGSSLMDRFKNKHTILSGYYSDLAFLSHIV